MKPLTDDEKWLLDQKVAAGETIKLWLVWHDAEISALRAAPPKLLYVDDHPNPINNATLSKLGHDLFLNYWHAYAYRLQKQGEKCS